ncbi:hypothetical protein CEXT_231251 [Caerostris extrusa]|uniref:Uncharacterized protein n=1 Tax=Caerostris extrusa TaxID=172846 RepID=A0AAV4R9H0_CAEEX|nr:hypothetical protein CEXT_231251 [Caerostris extrusa]
MHSFFNLSYLIESSFRCGTRMSIALWSIKCLLHLRAQGIRTQAELMKMLKVLVPGEVENRKDEEFRDSEKEEKNTAYKRKRGS